MVSNPRSDGFLDCWVWQFGTPQPKLTWNQDFPSAITVDSVGNRYVSGGTTGAFPGFTPTAFGDFFLVKFDKSGNIVWVNQGGGNGVIYLGGRGIALDSSGNVFVAGPISFSFPGYTNLGGTDVFIAKFNGATGEKLWLRQFGTNHNEFAPISLAVDSVGNAYVVGETQGVFAGQTGFITPTAKLAGYHDSFIAKYTSDGSLSWVRQFGTPEGVNGRAVAVDSGDRIYVAGWTRTNFPGQTLQGAQGDAYLAQYDSSGNRIWLTEFGLGGSTSASVVDLQIGASGTIYAGGGVSGSVGGRIFVAGYNPSGAQLWVSQFGESSLALFGASLSQIGIDPAENVYITGYETQFSSFPGTSKIAGGGYADSFIARVHAGGGGIDWARSVGTASGSTISRSITTVTDTTGSYVLVTGQIYSSFTGMLNASNASSTMFISQFEAATGR